MKDQILNDLNALAKTGIRMTSFVVEAVREGQFDDVIDEFQRDGVSVELATEVILELASIRGIRI